jgi:hypothetical protein
LGNLKEHDEKMLGTHWDEGRKNKKQLPPPYSQKEKQVPAEPSLAA